MYKKVYEFSLSLFPLQNKLRIFPLSAWILVDRDDGVNANKFFFIFKFMLIMAVLEIGRVFSFLPVLPSNPTTPLLLFPFVPSLLLFFFSLIWSCTASGDSKPECRKIFPFFLPFAQVWPSSSWYLFYAFIGGFLALRRFLLHIVCVILYRSAVNNAPKCKTTWRHHGLSPNVITEWIKVRKALIEFNFII